MNNRAVKELLNKLTLGESSHAWKVFLEQYTSLILQLAKQYQLKDHGPGDCYLYVCERLSENSFCRLTSYKPQVRVPFEGWLRVVVSRLCIDWYRAQRGRLRPFSSISSLPRLERLVYKYKFEHGMNLQACLHYLLPQFPELTEPQLAGVISQLNTHLSPRQHWLLSARHVELVSIDDSEKAAGIEPRTGPSSTPEALAQREEDQARLHNALAKLEPSKQLLLKLRFQQGLTLKEVACLSRLDNEFQARYQIQAALDELASLLKS